MMHFRRAAALLVQTIRFPYHAAVSSSGRPAAASAAATLLPSSLSDKLLLGSNKYRWSADDSLLWTIISTQTAIILAISSYPVSADASDETSSLQGAGLNGLQKIEDGSVISNVHTTKWRVFTDQARELFLKGQLDEAEKFFHSALQEAKEGFGERDPHVASACNNLAELYRVKKAFDRAEPLYLEAISMLEESFGPEDVRVGVAIHNLGQFYLGQRKLEEARKCYERGLKIKGRVLGYGHTDYADTMFHLGTVLHLQGKEKDAEALIQDSIRILEEGGLGESPTCLRRLRHLAQIYIRSNRPAEAENVQRKILHILELSKGWSSLETVNAAEGLALALQSIGSLKEARELLERCLDARRSLLSEDHIQIGATMLHIARVAMLNSSQLRKTKAYEAIAELERAKDLLCHSTRVARKVLNKLGNHKNNKQMNEETRREGRVALIILLQSLGALGLMEVTKQELQGSQAENSAPLGAEKALSECISAYKEFEGQRLISDSVEVTKEYLSCLKHLVSLIGDGSMEESQQTAKRATLQELNAEIKRVEAGMLHYRRRK